MSKYNLLVVFEDNKDCVVFWVSLSLTIMACAIGVPA